MDLECLGPRRVRAGPVFVPIAWPWRALLAALWLASPFALFPCLPWTIRIRIGAPIPPAELFGGETTPESLARALATVEQRIEALIAR